MQPARGALLTTCHPAGSSAVLVARDVRSNFCIVWPCCRVLSGCGYPSDGSPSTREVPESGRRGLVPYPRRTGPGVLAECCQPPDVSSVGPTRPGRVSRMVPECGSCQAVVSGTNVRAAELCPMLRRAVEYCPLLKRYQWSFVRYRSRFSGKRARHSGSPAPALFCS